MLRARPWTAALPLAIIMLVMACGGVRGRIINPGVPRNPVVFESPRAAELFDDALRDRYDDGAAKLPGTSGILSRNAFFNREVEQADRDGDGILSEAEALEYAAQ